MDVAIYEMWTSFHAVMVKEPYRVSGMTFIRSNYVASALDNNRLFFLIAPHARKLRYTDGGVTCIDFIRL